MAVAVKVKMEERKISPANSPDKAVSLEYTRNIGIAPLDAADDADGEILFYTA